MRVHIALTHSCSFVSVSLSRLIISLIEIRLSGFTSMVHAIPNQASAVVH